MNKNILLIGKGTIAVNCLSILKETNNLPKIIICDSNDLGKDTWTKSLFKKAKELGFVENKNLFRETKVNKPEFIEKIRKTESKIDIIFSIQPKAIFKIPFINLARDYVVNLHFAPLPKLRGVAPCSWAFLDGLKEMGVTLHLIEDEGIDNGPIIFQKLFPIRESDNAWTLFNKCIKYGTELFKKNLNKILNNEINPVPQNEKKATYHPQGELDFSDLAVDLNKNVDEVFNFIRSRIFPPLQLPYFIYKNRQIFILDVKKLDVEKKYKKTTFDKKLYFDELNKIYYLFCIDGLIKIDKYKLKDL